jgi:hypothetical protein
LAKPGIDDLAPRLLAEMISDKATKRPVDEPTLAEKTKTGSGLVRKCLLLLAEDGLVRELDRENRMWEISHDFVVRQLGQIIPRLRPSPLRRVQARLAPAALLAWLVLLPALAWAGPELMSRYATNQLSAAGVWVPWSDSLGGYMIAFGSAEQRDGSFDRLHGWLRWVRPIRSIRIEGDADLTDLSPLLEVIEPRELTQLTISSNESLQALPAWDGLGALTQLSISRNESLQALPAWDGLLGKLEELRLEGLFLAQVLPELDGLPHLRRLLLPADLAGRIENNAKNLPNVDIRFAPFASVWWWSPWPDDDG